MSATAPSGQAIIASRLRDAALPGQGAYDPSSGDFIPPRIGAVDAAQVAEAVAEAAAAAPRLAELAPVRRASLLGDIADRLDEAAPALLARARAETGLPASRLSAELARTSAQLRLLAATVRDRPAPVAAAGFSLVRVPLGPVAVFGASNFPFAFSVAGGDTAAALAAGCPVVVRAHPAHPGTAELVGRLVADAVLAQGLPPGTFSLLVGDALRVGAELVAAPGIAAVGFTGSRAGGLALAAIAAERAVPIPVFAEMSSVNPVAILSGAAGELAEEIAAGYVESFTLGAGQYCTNPGLVFLPSGPHGDAVVRRASALVAERRGETMLTAGIHRAYLDGVAAREGDGARTIARGVDGPGPHAPAPVLLETDAEGYRTRPGLREEVFGPASLVVRYRDHAELLGLLASVGGQLTGSVHFAPGEEASARAVVAALRANVGRLVANGWPTGVAVREEMVHGGPFPATTDGRFTSVGTLAIERFERPVCVQGADDELRDLLW